MRIDSRWPSKKPASRPRESRRGRRAEQRDCGREPEEHRCESPRSACRQDVRMDGETATWKIRLRRMDSLRLRLLGGSRARPRAPRRQGRRARPDDGDRHSGPRRLHGHDRRLHRLHAGRRQSPEQPRGRGRRAHGSAREVDGKAVRRPEDPLLVSVRSGAAVSMPGMMDTILNLGPERGGGRGSRTRNGERRASPGTPTGA